MTQEDKELLAKNISANVVADYNGWYTIEIYYKGEFIKNIIQNDTGR